MVNIILFGKAHSGKSTIAKLSGLKCYSLADKVKETFTEVSKIFGQPIDINDLYNENKEKYRQNLQFYATEIFKDLTYENIWCDVLVNSMNDYDNIIIDDGRFINEYKYFKKLDFVTIKVISDNQLNLNHRSEKELDNIECDYTIYNHGKSKDELEREIKEIINKLKTKN